ncbi:MAG: hypothetical protein WED34_09040 [Planctomycetales bacterium]
MATVVDDAFAFFVTWTTYGTWLPGDPRSHASNVISDDRRYVSQERRFATPYTVGDERTLQRARQLQKDATARLDADLALVAAHAIIDACRERGWRISRGALIANHVHCVVMDCPADGPSVRRVLKGVSQAKLCDHAGINRRWWTRGGSNRPKHGGQAVAAANDYVENQSEILVRIAESEVVSNWPPRISR